MKTNAQEELIKRKQQYHDYVYEHATFLSPYKFHKILYDFDVELEIAQKHWDTIGYHSPNPDHAAFRETPCKVFIKAINMLLAYADRSFQLIVAQSGLFIPFDTTSSAANMGMMYTRNDRIISKFHEYAQRSITLLPKGSTERITISAEIEAKTAIAIRVMDSSGGAILAENSLNDNLNLLFDDLRKVNMIATESTYFSVYFFSLV